MQSCKGKKIRHESKSRFSPRLQYDILKFYFMRHKYLHMYVCLYSVCSRPTSTETDIGLIYAYKITGMSFLHVLLSQLMFAPITKHNGSAFHIFDRKEHSLKYLAYKN